MQRYQPWIGATLAVALLTLGSTGVLAGEVYLNGVEVTGLKNQVFEGCTVRFDASGNVYVTAAGYTVKRVEQSASTQPAVQARVAKAYFLFSKAGRPGYAQYDIDVYLNGKWVRKVRNGESQVIAEITSHLRSGKNTVHFAATKNFAGKPRLSSAASDYLQVFVGLGTPGGAGTVNISTTLAEFTATAATTNHFGAERTFSVEP